jgi:poly(A) polymerase Pap1
MGVALEIMLVLVCQLYPNHSEFDILYNFFNVFAKWPWADESKGIVIITGAAVIIDRVDSVIIDRNIST